MARRKSSTDDHEGGWGLDEATPEFVAGLARKLGVELDRLAERLADPAWLRERLLQRTAFELVLLETLVDRNGIAHVEELWGEACRRAGIDRPFHDCEVWNAVAELGAGLGRKGEEADFAALLRPCVRPLQHLLPGVSLPVVGTLPPEAAAASQRARDVIAAAARTAHVKVKATQAGLPSRANRRAFAAEIGVTEGDLFTQLERAVASGLAVADRSGRLVPNVARLRAFAKVGFVIPTDRMLDARVRSVLATASSGVVPLEALVRSIDAERRALSTARGLRFSMFAPWQASDSRHLEAELRRACGLFVGDVDGVTVVGVPRVPAGEPDGHVLPNFDVMLGPGTSLSNAMVVALAAELVRLDRFATFRLTPESVRSAVSLGIDHAEILAALEAVGRDALPSNVARCVEEWAGAIVLGRVIRERVVVVPEAVAKRLLDHPQHGRALERLGPGIFAVAATVTDAQLSDLLSSSGVATPPESAAPDRAEVTATAAVAEGDAELRARVVRAMAARDFPELRHAHDDDASDEAEWGRVEEELRRWHAKLPFKARGRVSADALLGDLDLIGALVSLPPQERARILRRSTKPDQIMRHARAAIAVLEAIDDDLDEIVAPLPTDFPQLDARRVRRKLELCLARASMVHLLVKRGSAVVVTPPLHIDAVEPRGADVVVLAHDEDGEHGFAFPLPSITSVLVADPPPPPDDDLLTPAQLAKALGRR